MYFDQTEAEKAVRFIETYCRHVEGDLAGQLLKMEVWQKDFVMNIFGWKNDQGLRQYQRAALWIAKKNGKTSLAAAIALKLLCADGEKGAKVFSVACDLDQARLIYEIASGMVRADGTLSSMCTNFSRAISYKDRTFKSLSSTKDSKQGKNPSAFIVDEWAFHRDGELVMALTSGMAVRSNPLTIYLSTANFRKVGQPGWEFYNECKKVQQGLIKDDRLLVVIYEADEGDDPYDVETWKKANPNLGVGVKMAFMEEEARKAKLSKLYESAFKRYHLNMWTTSNIDFIDQKEWEVCGGEIKEAELEGLECYGGLDLASVGDFCSLALVFPGEIFRCLVYFWIPEDTCRDRKNGNQIHAWAEEGFITLTPGSRTDHSYIKEKILSLSKRFNIKEIAYDPMLASVLSQELKDKEGLNMIEFRQGWRSMSPATKELQRIVGEKKLNHGGNPVLTWQVSNVSLKIDEAENVTPHKGASEDKIDGVVALIMALSRAVFNATPAVRSIYEDM